MIAILKVSLDNRSPCSLGVEQLDSVTRLETSSNGTPNSKLESTRKFPTRLGFEFLKLDNSMSDLNAIALPKILKFTTYIR